MSRRPARDRRGADRCHPLLTLALATAALPTERATPRKAIGLLAGFLGVVLVIGPWSGSAGSLGGQLACVGAAVSYACGFVYVRKFLSPMGLARWRWPPPSSSRQPCSRPWSPRS
ncbi:DMT family transporter [Streptomyces sp. M19]